MKVTRGSRKISKAYLAGLGAAAACIIAAAALANDGAADTVFFTCTPDIQKPDIQKPDQITLPQAEMLCAAARRALENLPAPPNPPALHMIVTAANDRSAGLAGTWLFPSGQKRSIAPLRTSFFDTAASPALHDRFVKLFFQTNPIPSSP